MDNLELKNKVYQKCCQVVEDKITITKEAVEAAKQAAVEEERSTAGDKYDTARAMSHINQGMFASQLSEVSKLQKVLRQINIHHQYNKVESGALVKTSNGLYFIAVSLGAITIDGQQVMVISPMSPIGQLMLDKQNEDEILFNRLKIMIEDVF